MASDSALQFVKSNLFLIEGSFNMIYRRRLSAIAGGGLTWVVVVVVVRDARGGVIYDMDGIGRQSMDIQIMMCK